MFSWIVLIVLLAGIVIVAVPLSAKTLGRGSLLTAPDSKIGTKERMQANRAAAAEGNLDAVAFDVVSHGYRQDQVDDLIAALQENQSTNSRVAAKAPVSPTGSPVAGTAGSYTPDDVAPTETPSTDGRLRSASPGGVGL
ncbi:hypothetical protein [Corynebacterium phocae]|uniref:hypothetical protein n=1 Tax=Corynebacterium phocae TaxID=161895 RepID=UPI000952FE1B|nr:hypothetical protein [Corynebacterium phocae]KAA8723132.1 hypothetical protein F4V58_07355 [Corynebacterium phocae]